MFDESYLLSDSEYFNRLNESIDFKGFKTEFKKRFDEEKLTPQFIKDFFRKVYRQKPADIVDEIPNIGEIIRWGIIAQVAVSVNPFLGVFMFIADYTIKQSVNEKLIGKYITQYNSQLHKIEKSIEREKDPKKRAEFEKVKKELEESIKKLENKKYELEEYKDKEHTLAHEIIKENLDEYYEFVRLYEVFLNDKTIMNQLNESVKEKVTVAKDNVKKAENKMDEKFDDMLKDFKKALIGDNRDNIIKSSRPKLSKMIKVAVATGAVASINVTIAAVGLFTAAVLKKKLSEKEKMKILKEINIEIELVEEKIKDADSNGDKKKKYELMRLKHKLETDRDRIKRYIY